MTRKTIEGRHRVADGAVADAPLTPTRPMGQAALVADLGGRFTVQLLDDRWFIGEPGAAQRIEDGAWLDSWLTANGSCGRQDLDFGGDRELEARFLAEIPPVESHADLS